MATREEIKSTYLNKPSTMLFKEPFTRGIIRNTYSSGLGTANCNDKVPVTLPNISYNTVTQEQFLKELNPMSHDIIDDENVPSICVKLRGRGGGFQEMKYPRMPLAIQQNIKDSKVMHLCANKMNFTLMDNKPTEQQKNDFILFKQYWDLRNQDGMKYKMVDKALSVGDCGLLYYLDYKGRIKSRILAFPKYTIIPINDNNGDRLLECVYYSDKEFDRIDVYDDLYIYRFINKKRDNIKEGEDSFYLESTPTLHGFKEIPLISKRCEVAWNNVQSLIEHKEIIYNIYNVIQKRQGWGILFLKGNLSNKLDVMNGSLIAKAQGLDTEKSDMKYLTPPTGEGMRQAMELLDEEIQKGAGYTSILPKDIKSAGDISGVAVQLTMTLDNQTSSLLVIDWQNVADKMTRLFKYGLALELVNEKIQPCAITDFENLHINAKFKTWRPFSESEYNNMLISLKQAGLISEKTGIEKNTESSPDEYERRLEEIKVEEEKLAKANQVNVSKINVSKTENVEEI